MKKDYGKDYFRGQHEAYAFTRERRRLAAHYLRLALKMAPGAKAVLDAGCAMGYQLNLCDEAGLETYGVDISEYALGEAKKWTKARLSKCDFAGERLPLKDDSVDIVFALDVIEHLRHEGHFFREVHRVMRKGGVFLATTPSADFMLRRFLLKGEDPTHINVKGAAAWQRSLVAVGFSRVRFKYCLFFGLPPGTAIRSKLVNLYSGPVFVPWRRLAQSLFIFASK